MSSAKTLSLEDARRPHWIVPAYYRVRRNSYAYASLFIGWYLWDKGYPGWLWLLMALQLFVYPQMVYRRAMASQDSQKAELQHLIMDIGLWAVWSAALGFPLWISFTLFITAAVNNAFSRGSRGARDALLTYVLCALVTALVVRPEFFPSEDTLVIGLCVAGVSVYLLNVGNIAFQRTRTLREVREQLKASEAVLRVEAVRDPLTGVFNRRFFDETAHREMARSQRDGSTVGLMLLDVDHFKSVNDTYGHAMGDEVLRSLARLIEQSVRVEDVACRIGGEEFALLMPRVPVQVARARAEALRASCEQLVFQTISGPMRISVSIGVACCPQDGALVDVLMARADKALYTAKHSGRNCVRMWSDLADDSPGSVISHKEATV